MRLPATLAAFLTCIWWLAPWLATLAAGLLLVGTGGFGLRRSRRTTAAVHE
jgi:LPXTG-motif cell wall-anchored protein